MSSTACMSHFILCTAQLCMNLQAKIAVMSQLCYTILLWWTTLSVVTCVSNKLHSSLDSNINCSLWFFYNKSQESCQCLPYGQFVCDGKDAYLESRFELTYSNKTKMVNLQEPKGYRRLHPEEPNQTKPGYRLLPKNISYLNEFMCRPLNRSGFLCSDCLEGLGPAMSVMLYGGKKCYKCTGQWAGAVLYILIELVPITIIYLIILVFQVKLTSAPMICYIMYSQLIVLTVLYEAQWEDSLFTPVIYTDAGDLKAVSKIILMVYGMFNLDVIVHVLPPFCISTHLRPSHLIILGYSSIFYPILLIILTWLVIELHDRNVKVVVRMWLPFHRCFVRLRRSWNTKSDLIDVFASFLLLSYTKLMYQTILTMNIQMTQNFSLTEHKIYSMYVFYVDSSVTLPSPYYTTSVVIAGAISVIFNLLPMLLLALYPIKIFRKVLSKCKLDRVGLTIFMEKFHTSYKDGLDGGRDMRSFAALYFFVRVLPVAGALVLYDELRFEQWFVRGMIMTTTALIVALCRPYKKMHMTICDVLLLMNMAVVCYVLSSRRETHYFVPLMQAVLLLPSMVFALIISFKFMKHHKSHFITVTHQCLVIIKSRARSRCSNRQKHKNTQTSYGSIALPT